VAQGLGCALALLAAGEASAQSAGSYIGRVAVTEIKPDVTSGDLTPPSLAGTQATLRPNTQPTAGLTYMVTDHVSVDLPISAGYKFDILGEGAIAGVGKIGDVKAAPATLLLQYRFFDPEAQFRPYLGAGPTYAKFYHAESTAVLTGLTGGTPSNPTTLSVKSKLTATVEAGTTYAIAPRWTLDLEVLKTFLKTRTTLSTGQTLDTKLDPWTFSIGIGYRF
jgi:outer membrane protein